MVDYKCSHASPLPDTRTLNLIFVAISFSLGAIIIVVSILMMGGAAALIVVILVYTDYVRVYCLVI